MRCSRCGFEIPPDGSVPAVDAFSGRPICAKCHRGQRHANKKGPKAWLRVVSK